MTSRPAGMFSLKHLVVSGGLCVYYVIRVKHLPSKEIL